MPSTTEIIIIVVVIAILIAYIVTIFIMYDKSVWIFQDWEQNVPQYACKPLIDIIPLTTEQQQNIKSIINNPADPSYVKPIGNYPT